jgi:antimicrobial peptide system SdpB family protein
MRIAVIAVLRRGLLAFEPRSIQFGAARSIVAAAQLSVFVFNPVDLLQPAIPGDLEGVRCGGIGHASLWCFGPPTGAWPHVARAVCIIVLVVSASGYRPRFTCVPHWYVAFSMTAGLSVTNGGDHVAQILLMLMIPACLGDDRTWHWQPPATPIPASLHGSAYAAQCVLRLQAAVIYLEAGLAKVVVPEWRAGTALTAVAHHPTYGFPQPLLQLAESGSVPWLALGTWSAMGAELATGLLILGGYRARRCALAVGSLLHTTILVTMGLASFEVIMIALLIAVNAGTAWRPSQVDLTGFGEVRPLHNEDSPPAPAPASPGAALRSRLRRLRPGRGQERAATPGLPLRSRPSPD